MACTKVKHPLYACQVFKLLPYERKETIVKGNGYCFNCLNKGHISVTATLPLGSGVAVIVAALSLEPTLSEMPDAPSYLAT